MGICILIIVVALIALIALPRIVRMLEDACHFGPSCYFAAPRPGVRVETVALEDLPPDVKAYFLAALAAKKYATVSMDDISEEATQELPIVVATPDVCDEGEVYQPRSWYNVCARYRITVGASGTTIWHPLSMRLEMRGYANGEFFAVCNDPAAFCNSLEAISLKADAELDRSFAATFDVVVDLSVRYYRGDWYKHPFGRSLHGETALKVPFSRWGYVMSLAFRRGIVIVPAAKAAQVAVQVAHSQWDGRKANRGGEERARLQRNSRAFVRSQKEVELG